MAFEGVLVFPICICLLVFTTSAGFVRNAANIPAEAPDRKSIKNFSEENLGFNFETRRCFDRYSYPLQLQQHERKKINKEEINFQCN